MRRGKAIRILSRGMIVLGVLLMAATGVYEAANYPWINLFQKWGWMEADAAGLTPVPFPASVTLTDADPGGSHVSDGIPGEPGILSGRPPMYLQTLGVIRLPTLGVAEHIVEGSGDEMLYGVGHVRGTAMPGMPGNCVLAGHRNYIQMHPFRHMDKLQNGDRVTLTVDNALYTYEVFKSFEVQPHEVWVLEEQEDQEALLTLLTCTPVLNPTRRLIVWCRPVEAA